MYASMFAEKFYLLSLGIDAHLQIKTVFWLLFFKVFVFVSKSMMTYRIETTARFRESLSYFERSSSTIEFFSSVEVIALLNDQFSLS